MREERSARRLTVWRLKSVNILEAVLVFSVARLQANPKKTQVCAVKNHFETSYYRYENNLRLPAVFDRSLHGI